MTGFDPGRVSQVVGAALHGPGGVGLVVQVFAGIPGVAHTPAQRGLFSRSPERIQIGDWRFEVGGDGRLQAAHVVGGIVISEQALDSVAVGPHLGRALEQLLARYGPAAQPHIDAALDVLATSAQFGP